MPLVITPGAPDADSYVSVARTNAWQISHGLGVWTGTDEDTEVSLRRATIWIDTKFGARLPGKKTFGRAQSLAFPRVGMIDAEGNPVPSDIIPVEVEWATMEACIRERANPGILSPDIVPLTTTGGAVKRTRKKVGPLETETEYTEGASSGPTQPIFPIIEGILAGLLGRSGGGMRRLLRA